jgi:hypothetical protein
MIAIGMILLVVERERQCACRTLSTPDHPPAPIGLSGFIDRQNRSLGNLFPYFSNMAVRRAHDLRSPGP